MPRGWLLIAGYGLLVLSAFASALLVARELAESDGAELFGVPPLIIVMSGMLLLAAGIAGLGFGLSQTIGTAGPVGRYPASIEPGRPGPTDGQTDVMPAAQVAQRLELLRTAQAGARLSGSPAPSHAEQVPKSGWRTRLTDTAPGAGPAPPTLARIDRRPGAEPSEAPD